jgi:hypothetical protein
MDESYENDIICRDATLANPPGRILAVLPCEDLLRSQLWGKMPKRFLMASPLGICVPHVRRVLPMLRGGLYYALGFDPWS